MIVREFWDVDSIQVPSSHRATTEDAVKRLADSITILGMLEPIGCTRKRRLIYGRHRLDAYKLLGRTKIETTVLDMDDIKAEMAMIDENVCRSDLSVSRKAQQMLRRKELYLAMFPDTKHGGAPGKPGGGKVARSTAENHQENGQKAKEPDSVSFVQATAEATGKSKTIIKEEVAIGKAISPEVAEIIEGTPIANNKSELKKLGKLAPDEQRLAAEAIKAGEAKTVAEAVTPDDETEKRKAAGKQKFDPRPFARLESKLGGAARDIDALNKQHPGGKFYREAVAAYRALQTAILNWRKAG